MAKKLTKQINNQFIPTYISDYPVFMYGGSPEQYGFGSWLKSNAGTIGTIAGGIGGTLLGNPMLGAQIGGQIGGAVQGGYEQQNQAQQAQQDAIKQQIVANLPAHHDYQATFAEGGLLPSLTNFTLPLEAELMPVENRIYSKDMKFRKKGPSYFNEAQKLDMYRDRYGRMLDKNYSSEEKAKFNYEVNELNKMKEDLFLHQINPDKKKFADGGMLNSYNNTFLPVSDRLTEFKNGGSHESSSLGGIPIGKNALTEEGEFMFTTKKGKKYIFTDRF